jgi:molybdate transport system substrate-binding protein
MHLYGGNITIAVAANVSYAMEELVEKFQTSHPDVKVQTILGSSGKLTAQIRNGAPYEVFMAANMAYPEALYKDEVAITKPKVYARGGLALLSENERDFSLGLSMLTDEKIKKIAIANPKTAPYGTAAVEAMKNVGIYEKVKSKLVYGETISQTVAYAVGATDMGIVNGSAMYSDKMAKYQKGVHWELIDDSTYTPIDQGIVLLKFGAQNPDAKAFYDFILSNQAREILSRYGYLLP